MKTNRSLWSVLSFGGCLAVALSGAAGLLGGCAEGGAADRGLGEVQLAIANVPSDVHCFRVTAQGVSRTATRSIDVMPAQTIQTTLSGLPTGQVTFTGEGFDSSCAAVGAGSVAAWISDPVSATVATSPPVSVSLTLRRNGRATIGADFQDDGTCLNAGTMCMTDAQCCMGLTCASGVCAAPAMCMPPVPVAGDCRTVACDAAGNIVVTVDDTDVPDDGNACTQDLCLNGMPIHEPSPAGASCGPGLVCNGVGQCVGCLNAADCPGTDSECAVRFCSSGSCGITFAPAGVPTAVQIPGDCRLNQCDGLGNVVTAADATDLPIDGNQCTSDVCLGSLPTNPPVPAGTPCTQNGGSACDGSGLCI